ncbi:Uncharacterized protein M6B38_225930 [Iris pallida]|uniref:Uncharacterized protein n=1 Tax=Iris pallida TaxID=29817 RepID=A0AAX6DVI0_IRIPA|nr:Uncharacterized protein M6B38_225930 [Iris pallida]
MHMNMTGSEQKNRSDSEAKDYHGQDGAICLHAFSDLSHTSPATFVYLLKECYTYGRRQTATQNFKGLQQYVSQALHNAPQPGPATFIVQCLYIVSLLGLPYAEGFSHLLMSSLRRLRSMGKFQNDFSKAKHLAAKLFHDILSSSIKHEERILIKLLEHFDLELKDIGEAICGSHLDGTLDIAKAFIEHHLSRFMDSESYVTAVTLLEHFSIRLSGDSLLVKMMESNQFTPAEKWATFMGKPMICLLVQKYIDMKMLKKAYDIIKKNYLQEEFPDVHHLYKESVLKKLAEKGCWDIAELRAKNNRQLMEYLVYLAIEYDYIEKVEELCKRYSLDGFANVTGMCLLSRLLQRTELSSLT